MKPKDLKLPITFATRHPLFADSILYVPEYYANHHTFSHRKMSDYFGNSNPISIEYCSGNGDWILDRAQHNPDHNWVAVEKRFDRVRKIWSKMKNRGVINLLIVCGEALSFTKHYVDSQAFEHAYINFPDPWPKSKHAKHRLIHKFFLDEINRVLKQGKGLTIVTDDRVYLDRIISEFTKHQAFKPHFPPPYFTTYWPHYGNSWFDILWREKGREIHYTTYNNNEHAIKSAI